MLKAESNTSGVPEILIWLLVAIAATVLSFAIPQISVGLADEFNEYSADAGVISLLLGAPSAIGLYCLAVVAVLLRRIRLNGLIARSSDKWVKALIFGFFGLALAAVAMLLWLIGKNTLPPGLALVLISGILFSVVMALATASLRMVLLDAIATREDLEGVI